MQKEKLLITGLDEHRNLAGKIHKSTDYLIWKVSHAQSRKCRKNIRVPRKGIEQTYSKDRAVKDNSQGQLLRTGYPVKDNKTLVKTFKKKNWEMRCPWEVLKSFSLCLGIYKTVCAHRAVCTFRKEIKRLQSFISRWTFRHWASKRWRLRQRCKLPATALKTYSNTEPFWQRLGSLLIQSIKEISCLTSWPLS